MYARGYRSLVRASFALISIAVLYHVISYSVAYVSSPDLCEGDVLERRKCRECEGSGRDGLLEPGAEGAGPGSGERCLSCLGRGEVDVIVPGPNRPTRIWGAVVDEDRGGDPLASDHPGNLRVLPIQTALLPPELRNIPGALPGATLTFRSGARVREARADATGRFTVRLEPGTYTVTAKAPGHDDLEEEIEILTLGSPIWLEKATVVRPDESAAEIQASRGLCLLVGLARHGERGGFARLFASP